MIHGGEGSVADLCEAFVAQTSVTGAAFTVVASEAAREIVWASDGVSRRLAQFQYDLGEGPAQTALHERRPVLIGDQEQPGALDPWPAFAAQVAGLPARSLFTFPLQLGGGIIGVCDSYRDVAGLPSAAEVTGMLQALDRVTAALLSTRATLREPETDGAMGEGLGGYDATRAVVHQATGMVSVQLAVNVTEAFARLRAHAFGHDQQLQEAATAVVDGDLRLEEDE